MTDPDRYLPAPLRGGLAVAREARRQALALAGKGPTGFFAGFGRLLAARFEPLLVRQLRDALLYSYLGAARDWTRELLPPGFLPPRPPWDAAPPPPPGGLLPAGPFDPEPAVRLPAIEAAADYLRTRLDYPPAEYRRLDADARRVAFTVARATSEDAVQTVREALADDVRRGGTLREFRAAVKDALEDTGLADHQVEAVYRTQVGRAQAAGQQAVLAHPLVADEFPYLEYSATHDSRVRPDHLALESMGLDGTAVYRADDPIWESFYPPWAWNCVPGETRILTRRGQVRIDKVRKGDVVLTHRGRWRAVVGVHRSEGPAELVGADSQVGRVVRATGNHRVLTQRGWVEMAALNVKDHLYQVVDAAQLDLVGLKVQDRPGTPKPDMPVPLQGGYTSRPLYLDPDGQAREPEVNPIRRYGIIEQELNTRVFEGVCGNSLVPRHSNLCVQMLRMVSEMGRSPCHPGCGLHVGSSQYGSGGNNRCQFPPGVAGVFSANCFGTISPGNVEFGEYPPQRTESNTRLLTYIREGYATGRIVREHRPNATGPSGINPLNGSAEVSFGPVGLLTQGFQFRGVRITNLRVIKWDRRPVFNLSIEDDESYVADGVVMHNCRCVVFPISVEDAAEKGVREAVRWRDTGHPPAEPQFVPPPPFGLPKGWVPVGRRLLPAA